MMPPTTIGQRRFNVSIGSRPARSAGAASSARPLLAEPGEMFTLRDLREKAGRCRDGHDLGATLVLGNGAARPRRARHCETVPIFPGTRETFATNSR